MERITSLFFLFLILILLVCPSCISEDVETTTPDINFKPGSWIPTVHTWRITNVIPGKSPDRLRVELFRPDGTKAWMVDGETDYVENLGYGVWIVKSYDKDMFVPAFPQTGAWRVKFSFYSKIWDFPKLDNIVVAPEESFNVVEGGIMDNLMAPIYIFIEGPLGLGVIPTVKMALPGLFWLISPILVIIGVIITVRYWKAGLGGGMERLSRGRKNVKK